MTRAFSYSVKILMLTRIISVVLLTISWKRISQPEVIVLNFLCETQETVVRVAEVIIIAFI